MSWALLWQVPLGYATFCALWALVWSFLLAESGGSGAIGVVLLPSIPAIRLYVHVRDAIRGARKGGDSDRG